MSRPRRNLAGLTLIESVLLMSIVGVVAAVAIPTFVRAVEASKLSEASSQLAIIYQSTASYYATPHTSDSGRGFCLPEAAGPTPAKPSAQAVVTDFATAAGWKAMGFTPTEPLRFRYTYTPSTAACHTWPPATGAPTLVLRAEGDLDGDAVLSMFERSARATGPGDLSPDPILRVRDRVE